jgi:hypothetical protein
MQSVFINHTNHSSDQWTEAERLAAETYGTVCDIAFPNIDPEWDEKKIKQLAEENGRKILELQPAAVLCQGEFTYCFTLVTYLKEKGITVLSACSKRDVEEWVEDGRSFRTSDFVFVRFRRY